MRTEAHHFKALNSALVVFAKVRFFITLAPLLCLAGAMGGCEKFTETGESRYQKKVRYVLKDPQSAQFREGFETKEDSEGHARLSYCGEVNSKNSYGAFTGFKRFVVIDGGVFIEGEGMAAAPDDCDPRYAQQPEAVQASAQYIAEYVWIGAKFDAEHEIGEEKLELLRKQISLMRNSEAVPPELPSRIKYLETNKEEVVRRTFDVLRRKFCEGAKRSS